MSAKAALIDGNSNKSCGKLGKNSSTVPFREEHTDMNTLIDALAGKNDICLLPGVQESTKHNSDFYRQYKVKRLQLSIRYAHPHSHLVEH